ncbi:MAG: purine-binding chemotaxis protein CheW [SAR324 cluster bacterium]|nr:purine-binding chemotaxis protein CheW [SAR324 cluster bacterium]
MSQLTEIISTEELQSNAGKYRDRDITQNMQMETLLIFSLEKRWYGCSASELSEVFPLLSVTPLPFTHPSILGLTNVRGDLLLVCDIRKYFGLSSALTASSIIVVHDQTSSTGILAETVKGVDHIPLSMFQPALENRTGIPHEFIEGVTMYQGEILLWLSLKQIAKKMEDAMK